MEKDKEVCVLSKDRFIYYWNLLLLNYNQKHTQELQQKLNLYYSVFKDVEEEDFKTAIKKAMQNQKFFPNVNEIYKYLPTYQDKLIEKMDAWKNLKKEEASLEEQNELKKLLGV